MSGCVGTGHKRPILSLNNSNFAFLQYISCVRSVLPPSTVRIKTVCDWLEL